MKNLYLYIALFAIASGFGQTPEERERIRSRYDLKYLEELAADLKKRQDASKQLALELAAIHGWPETFTDDNGNINDLIGVQDDGISPIYYTTNNMEAATSTRTNYLHTGGGLNLGLDGTDMYMAYWDNRLARITHQEFGGRLVSGENIINTTDHATHVGGTIFASGVDSYAKGMAPEATGTSYYWDNDQFETIVEGAAGLLISNHSYGQNPIYVGDFSIGDYTIMSRDWDHISYHAPYLLVVTAAGNEGALNFNSAPMPGAGTTYDKLTGFKTSKNPLVVAAAHDAGIDADGNLVSVTMANFSSTGPTDDLRIKPDITGNGTDVYSSVVASDSSYDWISGTSMASPNVAGSLLLLQEYSRELNDDFMRASTLKGLALHTADDIAPAGPDAKSGWGLLNAKRAAETMTANGSNSLISELILEENGTYTFDVLSDGIHPFSVSICWTDAPGDVVDGPPANNPAPVLVSNLNLKVVQGPDTFFPYYLTSPTSFTTGVNNADPYERVDIPGAAGVYTIEVSHTGDMPYPDTHDYSIVITGIIVCTASVNDIYVTDNVAADEYDVQHSIQNIFADNVIDGNGKGYYRAGNSIMFTDGFLAVETSDMLAEIGDCGIIEDQSFNSSRTRPAQEEGGNKAATAVKGFMLYPNPAGDSVTLSLDSGSIRNIIVASLDGKAVMNRQAGGSTYTLDISSLESGLYLVTVETGSGDRINEKLVVK